MSEDELQPPTNIKEMGIHMSSSGVAFVYVHGAASTYVSITALSSTVPHTWANTDFIVSNGSYEVA
jgi:hypothetical protein